MRAVLVVPRLSVDSLARALAEAMPDPPDLIAVILHVAEAGATAVTFHDHNGAPLDLDVERVARLLSVGGHDTGVAHGTPQTDARRWVHFHDGAQAHSLDQQDELFLPVDEDGFPDLDVSPIRRADSPPEAWGRFRSCHDLGMKHTFSCRFGPVEHRLGQLDQGQDVGARAFAIAARGRHLDHPIERRWPPGPATT